MAFRLYRQIRNYEEPNSTCVDSSIGILEPYQSDEAFDKKCNAIRVELKYIQRFLRTAQNGDVNQDELVRSIEDEFEFIELEIGFAVLNRDGRRLEDVHRKLRKIDISWKNTPDESGERSDSEKTPVESVLDRLKQKQGLIGKLEWSGVHQGLIAIEIFLNFAKHQWSDTDEHVRLRDIAGTTGEEFKQAGLDIKSAVQEGHGGRFYDLILSLQKKIVQLMPEISSAYESLSRYQFEIPTLPPISRQFKRDMADASMISSNYGLTVIDDYTVWGRVCYLLRLNAPRILKKMEFNAILHAVEISGDTYALNRFRKDWTRLPFHKLRLGSVIIGVAIGLARIELLCSGGELNEVDAINMISDLLQRMKPTTADKLEMFMDYFSRSLLKGRMGIILPPGQKSVEVIHSGLGSLLEYLDDSYIKKPKDEELLRSDVEKVVIEVASLKYSHVRDARVNDEMIFQMLQKIELLHVEIFLTRFINKSNEITSIYLGIRLVQTSLLCSLELVSIFQGIERLANQVKHCSAAFRDKLFLEFKLMKIQAVLTDQMRCCSNLKVRVEERFPTINAQMKLLLKYLSLFPSKNQGSKKLSALIKTVRSNQVPDIFNDETLVFISKLLPMVTDVNLEIKETASRLRNSMLPLFPKTNQGLGYFDIFFRKLRGKLSDKGDSVGDTRKHQIAELLKEIEPFTGMEVGRHGSNDSDGLKVFWERVYEADHVIDRILLVECNWNHMLWLSTVIDEMKALGTKIMKSVQMKNGGAVPTSEKRARKKNLPGETVQEAMISLEEEENIIIAQLLSEASKAVEVVSICGMPGIGKTTLARKVYDGRQVQKHFHIRAWIGVSQDYRKRDLLLEILSYVTSEEMDKMTDPQLQDLLYHKLKGNRYLVVMDNVWNFDVCWNDMKTVFSDDDKMDSKILLTTQNMDVVGAEAQVKNSFLHKLRLLNLDESWELLRRRVFDEKECPPELLEVGREIAQGCKGLPLSVVAIAGVLKTTKEKPDMWNEIKNDLNNRILENPKNPCMPILELSYQHLPDKLKPCFLYFAAFEEDGEVLVERLTQYWTAEGFVRQARDGKPLPEDKAEKYVNSLISSSLVMAVKTGWDGRVKACKVHSLIHKLCSKKVEDENFLQLINEGDATSSNKRVDWGIDSTCDPIPVPCKRHRISVCSKRNYFATIEPSESHLVRTLLFSAFSDTNPRCPYDAVALIPDKFKILSMLDIERINFGASFPKGIELLYPLRFLAISGDIRVVPEEVKNLCNLETFIVKGLKGSVELPETLWSMFRMRQLHVSTQAVMKLKDGKLESSSKLENMVSLSWPALSHGDNSVEMMKLFPKLRNLRSTYSESMPHSAESLSFPVLKFLEELESLTIIYKGSARHYCQFKQECFPPNLKKLSLSHIRLRWDDLSSIGKLPNLLVLKLKSVAFESPLTWEMTDDDFQKLEYLKLDSIEIGEWRVECDPIPNIRKLVLRSCIQLEEIPASFGEIATLEMIELKWCSVSAKNSVITILEQKLSYGHEYFKAFINGNLH